MDVSYHPLVSLIIPVFNRADILSETIESILNQDLSSWELILVDDGSTDNSLEVAGRYAEKEERISYYSRPSNMPKGANSCRNFGFTKAVGTFVKWVDSDDLLTPQALSLQLAVMTGDANIKVCFGQGEYFQTSTGLPDGLWSRKVFSDNIFWDYLRNQIRWPVGGPLWRKDFFDGPPFELTLRNSQEWLMHALQLLRLKESEYRIIENVIYKIRRGNVRMSSAQNRNATYFYNEYLARRIVYRNLNHAGNLGIRLELAKQMAIYYYHSLRARRR